MKNAQPSILPMDELSSSINAPVHMQEKAYALVISETLGKLAESAAFHEESKAMPHNVLKANYEIKVAIGLTGDIGKVINEKT